MPYPSVAVIDIGSNTITLLVAARDPAGAMLGDYPDATIFYRESLFDVLETQRILASSAKIAMLPGGPHGRMLANLMAAEKQG